MQASKLQSFVLYLTLVVSKILLVRSIKKAHMTWLMMIIISVKTLNAMMQVFQANLQLTAMVINLVKIRLPQTKIVDVLTILQRFQKRRFFSTLSKKKNMYFRMNHMFLL